VTALLAGLAVAVVALTLAFTVVLASWYVRDRRRRRARLQQRQAHRDELERARRQLRLRVHVFGVEAKR
jgi:Flp pilus assembly protein TadB